MTFHSSNEAAVYLNLVLPVGFAKLLILTPQNTLFNLRTVSLSISNEQVDVFSRECKLIELIKTKVHQF